MKRKVIGLVVTGWMVAALLLASCAPAAVREEEKVAPPVKEGEVVVPKEVVVPEKKGEWVKWTGTKQDGTVVGKMLEKPRYGGVHIAFNSDQPPSFDPIFPGMSSAWPIHIVNEQLLTRDWTKGPGGTNEMEVAYSPAPARYLWQGQLAERWEWPDNETIIYHIRKGVHYQNKPPVNGREFTAADVVADLRREWGPKGGTDGKAFPFLKNMKNLEESIYVSPTDKWAVVIKTQPAMVAIMNETMALKHVIMPPELIEKYGRWESDWKVSVGTGSFILTEYVGASSLTYVRNPNYWGHDPFFPENQLPYLDGFKILIIPDLSTQMAALRTGKIDHLYDLDAEDAEQIIKTNPELKWRYYFGDSTYAIFIRTDTKPFDDIRVRRALNMAIDKPAIKNDYFGGKAELLFYPIMPIPDFADMYVPLEKLPRSVQELYEYHPDKAKKLLAEAGYPQGFKIEVMTTATDVDLLSIVKDYWAKVGVELIIDVKPSEVFTSMSTRKTYKQAVMSHLNVRGPFKMVNETPGHRHNKSIVNEPWLNELFAEMQKLALVDEVKMRQLKMTQTIPANEAAWYVTLPGPYQYNLWQPWLKGFDGAFTVSISSSQGGYAKFAWLDQELKKAMGR